MVFQLGGFHIKWHVFYNTLDTQLLTASKSLVNQFTMKIYRISAILFLLSFACQVASSQQTLEVSIVGRNSGDEVKVIVQKGAQFYYEGIINDASGSESVSFAGLVDGSWAVKLDATGYSYPPSQVVEIPTTNTLSIPIEKYVGDSYTYEWNDDDSDAGHAQQSFINRPIEIIYLEDTIAIPENFSSHELAQKYGIVLDDRDVEWSEETSFKFLSNIDRLPFSEKHWSKTINEDIRYIVTLTDDFLANDVEISGSGTVKNVRISTSAFTYASPQIVIINELRGSFFSKRLYNACLRLITANGTDQAAMSTIASDRFGIEFLEPSDQLFDLMQEDVSNFQVFTPEEKLIVFTMLEELPAGMQKQAGLKYLVRRINGQPHPDRPNAAAIAWTSLETIEFMEVAFATSSLESTQRLILHEKSHFLWQYTFDQDLKDAWIEVGEWSEDPESPSGWSSTNTTTFVSPYAHALNPNEDMAESMAYYVQNPQMLQAVSIEKYEFIRDRIMHGVHYEAIIQENLTFEVYNLFPDYYFPGRIIGSSIQVSGAPDEDKTLDISIKLSTFNVELDGGKKAYLRFYSTAGTHIDIWLSSENGAMDSILSSTVTISKHVKAGHWFLSTINVYDQSNNIRYGNPATVGMNLFINNPVEDITPPQYIEGSTVITEVTDHFQYRSGRIYPNADLYNALKVELSYFDESPLSRMLARMTLSLEDNSPASSFSQDIQNTIVDNGYNSVKHGVLHFPIPDYYPTGSYFITFSSAEDVAENNSRCFYVEDLDAFSENNFDVFEDQRIQVPVTTEHPDYLQPIMDLNNMEIVATPTNPDAPNGETLVELTVAIRDTSDYAGFESGIRRISYTLKSPQGQEYTFSADQQLNQEFFNFIHLLKSPFPPGEWRTFELSTILPVGSVPGTWGLSSMQLTDRANNVRNYSFVETVIFDLLEADYDFTAEPTVSLNTDNYVTALNEENSALQVACSPCNGIGFHYQIYSEFGGEVLTGSGTMANDIGEISGIDLSQYPDGDLSVSINFTNEDSQLIGVAATDAIKKKLSLSIRIYLSGALHDNGGAVDDQGRPLMRDDLRHSPFTGQRYIPSTDPYSESASEFFDFTNSFSKMGPHELEGNQVIINPEQLFSVEGHNAIVDWVHVELRSADDYHIAIASRSGLLQRDGDIVDMDGLSPLEFQGVIDDSFYVVVNHRSHMAVMSSLTNGREVLDFTSVSYEPFSMGEAPQKTVDSQVNALWAGDLDCDGRIKYTSPDDDLLVVFYEVIGSSANFLTNNDNAIGYFQGDFDMNSKVKFTNPGDDPNFLFLEVILFPSNEFYVANFDLIKQQVPPRSN